MEIKHLKKNYLDFAYLRLPEASPTSSITAYTKAFDVVEYEEQTPRDLRSADGYFFQNEVYKFSFDFLSDEDNISHISSSRLTVANTLLDRYSLAS